MSLALIEINGRRIGPRYPTYVVAEMSGNHHHDYSYAVELVKAAKDVGADAVKLQTYTPDTITINCANTYFQVSGTPWEGRNLYKLYQEAYTPWDWQPKLKGVARDLGLDLFSTPFDETAVEFLEGIGVPAYKVASFEVVDLPLLRRIAQTGKPIIMSTGMASLAEIEEAVRSIRDFGGSQLALLKCTSAYPASARDMNLRTMAHLSATFDTPVGLSDHTLGIEVPIAAVALGACIVEKHFTLSRSDVGPDSEFSLEPKEFEAMVRGIKIAEQALGKVSYGASEQEAQTRTFRPSLFVVEDIKAGEVFTTENIRSIRPGHGLHTRYFDEILGRRASQDISRGTPLSWSHITR